MSGILIGVAAVIILVAAGTGASAAVKKSISALGSNTLTSRRVSTGAGGRTGGGRGGGVGGGFGGAAGRRAGGGGRRRAGRRWRRRAGGAAQPGPAPSTTAPRPGRPQLTLDDAEALVDPAQAPDVVSVAPVVSASSVTATDNGASHAVATFTGTSPELPGQRQRHRGDRGRVHRHPTTPRRNRVALLGHDRRDRASSAATARAIVGQTVQFNGVAFQVRRAPHVEGQHRPAGPGRPGRSPR